MSDGIYNDKNNIFMEKSLVFWMEFYKYLVEHILLRIVLGLLKIIMPNGDGRK